MTQRAHKPKLRNLATSIFAAFCACAMHGQTAENTPAETSPPLQITGTSKIILTATETDALYELGRQLFDEYAPEPIKENYEFIGRDQWNQFIGNVQKTMETGSMEDIASLEPKATQALESLRKKPELSDYADWLAERIEIIKIAKDAAASTAPVIKPLAPLPRESSKTTRFALPPITPAATPFYLVPAPNAEIPYYNLWFKRVSNRAKPKRADILATTLKIFFVLEKIPEELVWLAEIESSFNPSATSPVGARGLFQLMPATARSLGLSTFPIDERVQPGKNARAAARLLAMLYKRFNSWPLALAAYNAGEGRIAAALKKTPGAKTYADIVQKLPAETRLYVPQALATFVVRENVSLEKFLPRVKPTPTIALPATTARN